MFGKVAYKWGRARGIAQVYGKLARIEQLRDYSPRDMLEAAHWSGYNDGLLMATRYFEAVLELREEEFQQALEDSASVETLVEMLRVRERYRKA